MNPDLSVIVTTHNRPEYLRRAVKSVLNQSYEKFDCIVVDDGSQEPAEKTLHDFQDNRLKVIRHDSPRGGPAARNTGIGRSMGRYVAFLDDDDEYLKDKLRKQVDKMEKSSNKTGLVYTGAELVDEKGDVIRELRPRHKGNLYNRLLTGSVFGSVSRALVKRECFENVGSFDEDLKACQDWDMWLRISRLYEMDYVDEVLVRIMSHTQQISTNFHLLIEGRIRMVEKHANELKKYPDLYRQHLKRIAKYHFLNGSYREGRRWFGEVIREKNSEWLKVAAWLIFEYPLRRFVGRFRKFQRFEGK